jgi:hypothetical protein
MTLDFPNAPIVDQLYSAAGKNWVWDGEKWGVAVSGSAGNAVLTVHATVSLPAGFDGSVFVENTTSATITITLPSSPYPGEHVLIKDTIGNATAYHIAVSGGGVTIEGQPTVTIMYDYSWLDLFYAGTQWVQH